jgi:AcrR family transcriptional regulator
MAISEKRQEIINAALQVIAEHGFHEAPIALIAERAGVGAGTIYRYFATKDQLIVDLFQELHAQISSFLSQGYQADQPIRERFFHLGTSLLRYFIANPREFRFLEQFFNSPYGIEFRRDRLLGQGEDGDLYRLLLEEGLAQRLVKELPLVVLLALAIGPLLCVARDHIAGFVQLDEVLLCRTVQACWDSIKT